MQDKTFGCDGNTISLRSGRYLDLADPQPDQFTFADIAGGLSKICRFGGQVNRFYSVAEHCWHCCGLAKSDGQRLDTQVAVLMHDAAEAFIGDCVKPLKIMLSEYAAIERRIEAAIAEKFCIDFDRESYVIHEIDHAVLIAERKKLFSRDEVKWTGEDDVRRVDLAIKLWIPETAESQFTRLARCLGLNTES